MNVEYKLLSEATERRDHGEKEWINKSYAIFNL
jgi:hypothetical protein